MYLGLFVDLFYYLEIIIILIDLWKTNETGGEFTLLGYHLIRMVTDYRLKATPTALKGPLIGDGSAPTLALGQGPIEVVRPCDEKTGYDAYIIRQYLEPKQVTQDAIDKICT